MTKTPLLLPWLFFIISIYSALLSVDMHVVSGQCLSDQQSLLLQLKDILIFNATESTTLVKWNQSSDCCSWEGITCEEGRVTGLDLSNESISGGIDDNSTLFNLKYLKSLDLSLNFDLSSSIPSRIGNLTNLTYLNFSNAFSGQIPKEISLLTKLLILDLSERPGSWPFIENQNFYLKSYNLQRPNLRMLIRNLIKLEELYLDGVNISAPGSEWGQALSSSLPNLQVLSLSNCYLSGPIHQSLAKLHSLSVIRLEDNYLFSPVPEFFSNYSNLTSLYLSSSGLYGLFPKEIFQVPTIRNFDISNNELLCSLPEFLPGSGLQSLVISSTNFSGELPISIGNLRQLSRLDVSYSFFSGPLPNSITKLTKLVYLDLAFNNFTGPIPWAGGKGLLNLNYIHLKGNSFEGSIPSFLFSLPSLQMIDLSYNQLSGQVLDFPKASSSVLYYIALSSNKLHGPIPLSIFKLKQLKYLSLSSNSFNGTVQLDVIEGLPNLVFLDLSYNNLSVDGSGNGSNIFSFPKLGVLQLASCNLRIFPDLIKNQLSLYYLDISRNHIYGEIPNWIWNVGNGSKLTLNLSHNHFVALQEPSSLQNVVTLDLSFNQLHGKIPILPPDAYYIDLSNNYFTSIPADDVGNNLAYFSLANNGLLGVIPESICNASSLKVLDLSNNSLNGIIPMCIVALRETVGVNLRKNNLSGPIPDAFPVNCQLMILDLNGNLLTERIPRSLANCRALEVLNLGNNQILDTFPIFSKNLSTMRVLVLRSNKFYGSITCSESIGAWPVIQIFNVASNNFSGELPGQCLTKWHVMMFENDVQSQLNDTISEYGQVIPSDFNYEDAVTVTNKGLEMELLKIPNGFTAIDFSSNNFHGEISKDIGRLKFLHVLNLSNNILSGEIPSSFGNMQQLESLDLSRNLLKGKIPISLANLNFLSFLNLSYNQLVGRIPTGNQIQTFSADCFQGNEGLYGPPFTPNCTDGDAGTTLLEPSKVRHSNNDGDKIEWHLISAEIGFIVGFGIVIGPLVFSRRWRKCYFDRVEDVAFSILPQMILRKWLLWKMGNKRKGRGAGNNGAK